MTACALAGVDFSFKDPDRGFDRSRVKGVVARLVRVRDASAATALEVAAGGKLYQVGHELRAMGFCTHLPAPWKPG